MELTIRAATAEDQDILTAMFLDYGTELRDHGLQYELNPEGVPGVVAGRIKSRMFLAAVAQYGTGQIRGFVFCSLVRVPGEYLCRGSNMAGYLNDIYVQPGFRGRGLAAGLAAFAEDWLRSNGATAMELQVVSGNRDGATFWEGRGLRPAGTFYYKELNRNGER